MDASVRSLAEMAGSTAGFELLLGLDNDDDGNHGAYLHGALRSAPAGRTRYFARHGYRNLHLYYNALASDASGDWLLVWNDDARMARPNWDVFIHEHDHRRPVALNLTSEHPGAMNLFPCVSRAWYETVGHLSLQAHTDTWIQDVSREAGVERSERRVRIEHLRTGDGDPEVYGITSPEFYSPRFADLRAIDVKRLKDRAYG